METAKLKEFLSKYKLGLLSEEETLVLMKMLADEKNAEAIQEDIAEALRVGTPEIPWKEEWTAPTLKYIKEKTGPERAVEGAQIIQMRSKHWWKYAAVALLVISVGVLMYWGRSDHARPEQAVQVIEPGSNKARLTLADGSVIDLGEKANGQLTQQGGITVVKLDSGSLSYQGKSTQESGFHTLTTPRGGQFNVSLPDGTMVWLNSASSITYPVSFSGNVREVSLTGEGFFEVKENKEAPFIVKIGQTRVQVLGTGFNIMAYEDEMNMQTTLIHGSVKISTMNGEVIIKPGQQASLVNGKPDLQVNEPDIEQVLAWKNGDFNFDGANIQKIMRQVSRWYDVDIAYEGQISNKEFTGIIPRRENVQQVLDALELPGVVHFKIEGKKITVIEGPKTK